MANLPRQSAGWVIRTLLISLYLLALPTPGQGQSELIQSVGLMADDTASLDADAAALADFRPVRHTMTLGYSAAAQWLRLRILPAPDGEEVVLLVRPPLLDDVRLFVPILIPPEGAGSPPITQGYELQPADWPSSLRGYRLDPPPGGADYLIRISSAGSIAASVTAQTRDRAVRISLITDLVQICYFAAMLVLLLWSLRMLAVTREHLFAWYSATQAAWLVHNFLAFGYAKTLVPELTGDLIPVVFRTFVFVATFLSIVFHRTLLIRFRPSMITVRMFDVQLAVILVAFALYWVHDSRMALEINAYCIAVSPFLFLANIWTARQEASPGLTTMRVIYLLLSVALLLWVFALLGMGYISVFSLYGFMIHGSISGVLMFAILHLHGLNLASGARAAEARIAVMEHQRSVQQEKTRTLAQFIDMLTHEARNALSVINMSIPDRSALSDRQRERVACAIQGLTGVIDRCNQTIRLDSNGQAITREDCDLVDILRKLCADNLESARIDLQARGPVVMQADQVLLGVVFSNLLDNALKYSPAGSVVTVALDRSADGIRVLFQNTEGAASRPDPAHVFGKYYRNDRAKSQIGSGLGLYIVRGLVHLLGGRISYAPTDSHIRFEVRFPC